VDEIIDKINQSPEGREDQEVSDGTTSHNKRPTERREQELTEEVFDEYINEIQPSTSDSRAMRETSEGITSQKKKRPTRRQTQKRLTGQQILDKLKNSIIDVKKIGNTPKTITDLNDAKDVIKKKLSKIDLYAKLTINAVNKVGECLRLAKKFCKKKNKKFGEFLNEIEIKKVKMKPKTADHYIRIYKLCKDFPKFLCTTESFSFYIKNHKHIREALDNSPEESKFWSNI
jgi:hypothetical protein